MRSAAHYLPIGMELALGSFVNGCHTTSLDRGHAHFEERVDELNRLGYTLK